MTLPYYKILHLRGNDKDTKMLQFSVFYLNITAL